MLRLTRGEEEERREPRAQAGGASVEEERPRWGKRGPSEEDPPAGRGRLHGGRTARAQDRVGSRSLRGGARVSAARGWSSRNRNLDSDPGLRCGWEECIAQRRLRPVPPCLGLRVRQNGVVTVSTCLEPCKRTGRVGFVSSVTRLCGSCSHRDTQAGRKNVDPGAVSP